MPSFRDNALTWPAAFPEIWCDHGLVELRADGPSRRKPVPCELSATIDSSFENPNTRLDMLNLIIVLRNIKELGVDKLKEYRSGLKQPAKGTPSFQDE